MTGLGVLEALRSVELQPLTRKASNANTKLVRKMTSGFPDVLPTTTGFDEDMDNP